MDTDTVYTGGYYSIGIDYEFKLFDADAHFVSLDAIDIFTSDRLEVHYVWKNLISIHISGCHQQEITHLPVPTSEDLYRALMCSHIGCRMCMQSL